MKPPPDAVRLLRRLVVRARPRGLGGLSGGTLTAGALSLPCMLGPAGVVRRKREGDGGTPAGSFALLGGRFRADRLPRPRSQVSHRPSRPSDGWCDDPDSPRYNRPVVLPFRAGHELMWREDRLYDVVVVLDFNMGRRRRGGGSAIFLHVVAPDGTPTAGCVALRPADLRRLLPRLARSCRVHIG